MADVLPECLLVLWRRNGHRRAAQITNGLIIEQTLRATDAFAGKARECRHSGLMSNERNTCRLADERFLLAANALALQPARADGLLLACGKPHSPSSLHCRQTRP